MPLAAPPRPRPRPLPELLRTSASARGRLASAATAPDGEALSAVPVALGELAAAAPATSGGLPRRRLAGGLPVASAATARSEPEELLAAAAPDVAAAAAAATDRRGARDSPAADPLPLPLPPSAAGVAFASRSGTRSKIDLRKSNVSSAWTVDLRWAGVSVLARREDATPAACVSKSCRSISSALPTWGRRQGGRGDDAKRKRIARDRRKQGNGARRDSKGYRGQHQCASQAISSQHQCTEHPLTVARKEQGPRGDQSKREGHAKRANTPPPSEPQTLTVAEEHTRAQPQTPMHTLSSTADGMGRKRSPPPPSHHKRTKTGVAVATLPTSSSACIIFLMRDGGKAAVEDLRRPMAGDTSVETPDHAVRAFTWRRAADHGPGRGDKKGNSGGSSAKNGDSQNEATGLGPRGGRRGAGGEVAGVA